MGLALFLLTAGQRNGSVPTSVPEGIDTGVDTTEEGKSFKAASQADIKALEQTVQMTLWSNESKGPETCL